MKAPLLLKQRTVSYFVIGVDILAHAINLYIRQDEGNATEFYCRATRGAESDRLS